MNPSPETVEALSLWRDAESGSAITRQDHLEVINSGPSSRQMMIASTVSLTLMFLSVLSITVHRGMSLLFLGTAFLIAFLIVAVNNKTRRDMERVVEAHRMEANRYRAYLDAVAADLQRDSVEPVDIDYSAGIITTVYGAVLLSNDGTPYAPDDNSDDD